MSDRRVDVRGPRFSAAITVAVVVTALAVRGDVGQLLLAWQAGVFAVATITGPHSSPYAWLFRTLLRRGVFAPTSASEPEAGPRFAQGCGLVVAAVGLAAVVAGFDTLGWTAAGVVAALAALQAFAGVCVGCEVHALLLRVRAWQQGSSHLSPAVAGSPGQQLRTAAGAAAGTGLAVVVVGTSTCTRCPATLTNARAVVASLPGAHAGYVDALEAPALAAALRVRRSPTVFVIADDGEILARRSGAVDAAALAHMVTAPSNS